MHPLRFWISIWVALLPTFTPRLACGHGGVVQLQEAKGPFSVTVFVASDAAGGGLTDVSVLVQSCTNGAVVLDADVELAAEPPNVLGSLGGSDPVCGMSPTSALFPSHDSAQRQETVRATREQAANKLLYAASLALNATGNWRLRIQVSHGPDSRSFDCSIPVLQTSGSARAPWPYLLISPVAIIAFAMNQKLRKQFLEKCADPDAGSFCRP